MFGKFANDDNYLYGSIPQIIIRKGKNKIILGQSNAVLRFAGKKAGLYPKNDVLAAIVDGILGGMEDLLSISLRVWSLKDEKEKLEKGKYIMDIKNTKGSVAFYLKKFESIMEKNETIGGHKNGFIVGNDITIADLKVYYGLTLYTDGFMESCGIKKDAFKDFKKISNLLDIMSKDKRIIEYKKEMDKARELFTKDEKNCLYEFKKRD